MTFSLVTIVYEDERHSFASSEVCQRIRDVHASGVASGLPFDLIVLDNSPRPIVDVQNLCCDLDAVHQWSSGFNLFHGPAMNVAATLSQRDAIIYFCASHGRVIDDSWITDILAPLADQSCGIAGSIAPCLYDRISIDHADWKIPQVHVQGAVAAMRRETMLEVPYGHRFPFEYSDVAMCLDLIHAGYRLVNVPSIRSVAIGRANIKEAKYVHDYV